MTPHECNALLRTYRSLATPAGAPPRLARLPQPTPAPRQAGPSGAILAGLLFLVAVEALALALVLS